MEIISLVVQILGRVKDGPSWHIVCLKQYSQGLILLTQAVVKTITNTPQSAGVDPEFPKIGVLLLGISGEFSTALKCFIMLEEG